MSTKVLIVDDAAFMRRALVKLLSRADDIEVVGQAQNGVEAVELFNRLRPDVICLDVDMPKMDGVTALKHFMATRPTPVIVISSMTDRADIPFELFRLGVIEFFPKPSSIDSDPEESAAHLVHLIRNSSAIRVDKLNRVSLASDPLPQLRDSILSHVIVMAGLVGSVGSFIRVLSLLPSHAVSRFAMVCMIPVHRAIAHSFLGSVSRHFGWHTRWLKDADDLRPGTVFLIPESTSVEYPSRGRCAAAGVAANPLDTLFANTARAHGGDCSLMLLAGTEPEGIQGLDAAAKLGAACYIQDPETALFSTWTPGSPKGVAIRDIETVVEEISLRAPARRNGSSGL